MADNIEFVAAKDLPVSESESVDVLCVDDGELKRKPAANLGGGGGGGYVIHVPVTDVSTDSTNSNIVINLTESWDNFLPLIWEGGSVWLDLSAMGMLLFAAVTATMYEDGIFILISTVIMGENAASIQCICTNGTWVPPGLAATE